MLSTQYRLKLEAICERIVNHEEVSLEEGLWGITWFARRDAYFSIEDSDMQNIIVAALNLID